MGEVEVEVACFERERASQMSLAFPGDGDRERSGTGKRELTVLLVLLDGRGWAIFAHGVVCPNGVVPW